ncbi:MAG TPA: M1 family aminopeptidase [Terriglobales bacterium]|nr:M1 family aminopeptidase [Terriglobales bacterium]
MKHHCARIAWCALLLSSAALFAADGPIRYDIELQQLNSVSVSLAVPFAPERLYMSTGGTGSNDGFAGFVRDLRATCGDQAIVYTRAGAEWLSPSAATGPCTISYRVDLSFTRAKWEAGNEQAGYADGRGVFLSSKAVFIETPLSGRRTVRFHVKPGWRFVSPWTGTADGTLDFGREGMLQDIFAFGDLDEHSSSTALFRTRLVTFGALRKDTVEVGRMLDRVTRIYSGIFPETPSSSYVVVLLPGDEADGESYANGFASTLRPPLKGDDKIVWADTIAHEIFHHWCGGLIKTEDHGEMEWFTEGFTEYFANLALIRSHEISTADFLQKVAINIGQYEYFLNSSLFRDVTIEKAGQQKGRNRFGVYASGWVMAFVLDQEIRKKSGGAKSLEDVMREALKRSHQSLTPTALLEIVAQVGAPEIAELIHRGISTRESIQPESYLPALGLTIIGQDYQGEYYVHLDNSNAGNRKRRSAWAGF